MSELLDPELSILSFRFSETGPKRLVFVLAIAFNSIL